MHIGLCAGPCIKAGDYAQRVKNVRRILNGDAGDLIEELATKWISILKPKNTKLLLRLEIRSKLLERLLANKLSYQKYTENAMLLELE